MKINITARHFRAKESTREYIREKLGDLERYNENIIYADVILSYDKPPADTKYCEILLKVKEKTLASKADAPDFDKAIDLSALKIETQLHKLKDKQKSKKNSKTKK